MCESERNTKKLTDDMKDDLVSILERWDKLNNFVQFSPNPILTELKQRLTTELNTYKLKLEQMLSETDDKKEQTDLLNALLILESLYSDIHKEMPVGLWGIRKRTFSEDYRRYVEMGMRLAPENVHFNLRYVKYGRLHTVCKSLI